MKTIIQAMLDEIYENAIIVAHGKKSGSVQAIHNIKDKNDGNYYITLRQLEEKLKVFEG